ncbi:hypothetical protein HOLleu_23375 [Holothuria leucospilota]|uniref:RNase H type-1 domain-containing protein n=1 Tax=Holothuria leucospilota TaxID=206669 RepID=A0A9Q1H5I1_HOLLE|nr:hypothetical protein HOLleu_23375 [Holothuria leucospilota]
MTVRPTEDKTARSIQEFVTFRDSGNKTVRDLAQVIGLLVSLLPGILYGKLHYRNLQFYKIDSRGNFNSSVTLSCYSVEDLNWWMSNLPAAYMPISQSEPNMCISTDASSIGWGAYCATTGPKVGGGWSPSDSSLHINVLELLAILMGLTSLCSHLENKHIKIMCDNSTAVSYINAMGGTHSVKCNI